MKSGLRWAITLFVFPLVLALPAAAQTDPPPTDTTVTTDTTWTTDTGFSTETVFTETSTTDVTPTDTESTTTYYEEESWDEGDAEEGAKVCAACAAFGVVVPLILLGISVAIALWVYRDARERGITSAPLWALLGFLFNILGLVIYLIARKNMQPPSAAAPGSMPPPPPPA